MKKIALIIGATGATGKDLVAQLLADEQFDEVRIFVRRRTKKYLGDKLITQ